jgi:hypothetical protein
MSFRYLTTKNEPAAIVSWCIPGNVYPVREHHISPESLCG